MVELNDCFRLIREAIASFGMDSGIRNWPDLPLTLPLPTDRILFASPDQNLLLFTHPTTLADIDIEAWHTTVSPLDISLQHRIPQGAS